MGHTCAAESKEILTPNVRPFETEDDVNHKKKEPNKISDKAIDKENI